MARKKRLTITFQPDKDAQSLLSKELNRIAGVNGEKHGLRSRLINEAIRLAFNRNKGKRELLA
ncbi:MAG TPA: hypothetical protein VFB72_01245 [Verrucomicrobiae bacterium]|nr:hypothetical protein [Verrucomicrobiae bacterium]